MDDSGDSEDRLQESAHPALPRELFLQFRSPREGTKNPDRMNNPVWEWLVRTKVNAYHANQLHQGPSAMEAGPGWCFERFGQTETQLPDGRIVLIAGEHEDSYDPDFFIYNDVVVKHPDGRLDIFGYPKDVFPPTDFHSATLVGAKIFLIGNLGYPVERRAGTTQVMMLDLETFSMATVSTAGTGPGWIHRHEAVLSQDATTILVRGGKVDRDADLALVENIDEWRLNLTNGMWERLTDRRWPRWEIRRKDRKMVHLFAIQQRAFAQRYPDLKLGIEDNLDHELGKAPDLQLFSMLYCPPIPHEQVPDSDDEFGVHRIKVNGVVVRYVQELHSVHMTVEGELPPKTLEAVAADLIYKLSALENHRCEAVRL